MNNRDNINNIKRRAVRASLLIAGLGILLPAASAAVYVPAGTPISIRTINGINSKTAAPGERFRGSVADPVVVRNIVAIPRGANATVELVRTAGGSYALRLYDVTVRGRRYDVASSSAVLRPSSTRGKTARRGLGGAGIGAAIGGIAGGGKGAAIGAVAGGGVGAASGMAGGKKVEVPPETLLNFELRAPLTLRSVG